MAPSTQNTVNSPSLFATISMAISLASFIAVGKFYTEHNSLLKTQTALAEQQNALTEEQNTLARRQIALLSRQYDIERIINPTVNLQGTIVRRNQNLCLIIRNIGNKTAHIESIAIDGVPIDKHPLFDNNSFHKRNSFLREIPPEGETVYIVKNYIPAKRESVGELIPNPFVNIRYVSHKPEPNHSALPSFTQTGFQVSFPEKVVVPANYGDIIKKNRQRED